VGHARDTILRKDPAAAIIIRAWRSLSGGEATRDPERRTLIACSGGCDSSALALTLAAASDHLVIAHIVHDLRPAEQSHADRDAAHSLAAKLDLPFAESSISARAHKGNPRPGNLEASARRLRYHALASLASQHHCPFIATAHHADDLLETMLMRLLRGTGPAGLSPIRPSRVLGHHTLIRPMLHTTRADAERLCTLANHPWQTDATNADTSRLRNDLRANVLPHLRRLSPTVAEHAATTSELLAQSADVIHTLAHRLRQSCTQPPHDPHTLTWPRAKLRRVPAVVLGELLRQSAHTLAAGWRMDRLSSRVLTAAANAIRDQVTDPRTFTWAPVTVTITAHTVTLTATQPVTR
jgi:tRNA(Ile)-lysidine synthetase-like protein